MNSFRTHTALVRWLSPQERRRKELPATLRYIALSRFPEDGDMWPDGAWSIEVLFDQPPPEQLNRNETKANIRFLFGSAPQERLRAGAQFSLYEGPHKVAEVDVLD